MTETPLPIDPKSTETGKPLASEQGHWYAKDGSPVYEVEAKKCGMRATTIRDAFKLDLVPSVTSVLNIAAKPGLEAWKAKQILEASLTLPRITGESLDDYATRVIEDAKAQGKKAAERGTELHAAIEQYIRETAGLTAWDDHILAVTSALLQHGIDITEGKAEHSFASQLGYGGKIDWHNDEPIIIDFKTKDRIDDKKPLVWPEHVQQLSAYGVGLGYAYKFRALNVFIGVEDKQVRVFEHEWPDIVDGFGCFRLLLEYWQRTKKFGPYAK